MMDSCERPTDAQLSRIWSDRRPIFEICGYAVIGGFRRISFWFILKAPCWMEIRTGMPV